MDASSAPVKFSLIFASSAGGAYLTQPIPTPTQSGPNVGRASLQAGFPPITFVDPAAGGTWPDGRDVNGILYMVSAVGQWTQAGGLWVYDSAFSGSIGGYPQGAVLGAGTPLGVFWQSQVDGNTSNPDAGGANWERFSWARSYAGNPNGHVAGVQGSANGAPDLAYDLTDGIWWYCTTSGNAASAIWSRLSPLYKPTYVYETAPGAWSWLVPSGVTVATFAVNGASGGGGGVAGPGAGSGGGGGARGIVTLSVVPGTTVSGSIGAAGTAGTSSSNAGPGGDTTVVYNAITYRAGGGLGGLSASGGVAQNSVSGGSPSGPWDLSQIGQPSFGGVAAVFLYAGRGGLSPDGGFGGQAGTAAGNPGGSPGGGGGGSADQGSANVNGGIGAPGRVIISY